MIQVDEALREHEDLDCHMLLTVHDELVFEVPEAKVEAASGIVKDRMEHAVDLEVPLPGRRGLGHELVRRRSGGSPRACAGRSPQEEASAWAP